MRSLYEPAAVSEILDRIGKLHSQSERQWGKMNTAQMLAHCTIALEVASAKTFPPRMFIGYILGPVFKPVFTNEKPFGKNSPTAPSFMVADERDFNFEKGQLIALISEFYAAGEQKCTTHPHVFFGKLTPQQWGIGMYKHLDHHLRQFGV